MAQLYNNDYEEVHFGDFKLPCCGHCLYHMPSKSRSPKNITSGKGKGRAGWWKCDNKECEKYGKGTVYEDGEACKGFKCKYDDHADCSEWLKRMYPKRNMAKKSTLQLSMMVDDNTPLPQSQRSDADEELIQRAQEKLLRKASMQLQ